MASTTVTQAPPPPPLPPTSPPGTKSDTTLDPDPPGVDTHPIKTSNRRIVSMVVMLLAGGAGVAAVTFFISQAREIDGVNSVPDQYAPFTSDSVNTQGKTMKTLTAIFVTAFITLLVSVFASLFSTVWGVTGSRLAVVAYFVVLAMTIAGYIEGIGTFTTIGTIVSVVGALYFGLELYNSYNGISTPDELRAGVEHLREIATKEASSAATTDPLSTRHDGEEEGSTPPAGEKVDGVDP